MIGHGSLPRMPSLGSSCNPPQILPLRGEGTRDEAQRTSALVATQQGRFGCNREKLDVIVFHYPIDSTRFSWPNHGYIARMTVIQWNPDALTTLGKADYGSNYCGSLIGFFHPVIPTQNFGQSRNPACYFGTPPSAHTFNPESRPDFVLKSRIPSVK